MRIRVFPRGEMGPPFLRYAVAQLLTAPRLVESAGGERNPRRLERTEVGVYICEGKKESEKGKENIRGSE